MSKPSLCLVTSEYNGPWKNGGIGTAFCYLARFLVAEGYNVTVLYTAKEGIDDGNMAHWVATLAEEHVTFVPLMTLHERFPKRPPENNTELSFHVYQWLKEHRFAVIHFHDYQGLGYHSLKAKHQGLAFADTTLCVQLHGPSTWVHPYNQEYLTDINTATTFFQERESIALADYVISPSQYMLNWCRKQGWALPEKAIALPNLYGARDYHAASISFPRPINELVFFGRLEPRKGLELFCQALARIPPALLAGKRVTFLGKPKQVSGTSSEVWIEQWCGEIPYHIIPDYDQQQALAYLKSGNRLAVIPSLDENFPYTVLECIIENIPFVATKVGGIPEMVDPASQPQCLCPPRPGNLSQLLAKLLENGATCASTHVDLIAIQERWRILHKELLQFPAAPITVTQHTPLVSVCLVHYNRPHYLHYALESIEQQHYQPLEVILVDDGSTDREAHYYLETLEPQFVAKGWQLIRQENSYLGAARNNAVRHARGEYVKFMDDDNIAMPHEIATLVQVALHTGADIVTCCLRSFEGDGAAPETLEETIPWVPHGVNQALGVLLNSFGDANALVKKSTFEALGGFTEDYGIGHEDWELFAEALLSGYQIELVPEALFLYRVTPGSMQKNTRKVQNHLRNLRPYPRHHPEFAPLFYLAQGLYEENKQLRDALAHMQTENKTLHASLEEMHFIHNEVLNSTSWKVTAPIRQAVTGMKGRKALRGGRHCDPTVSAEARHERRGKAKQSS